MAHAAPQELLPEAVRRQLEPLMLVAGKLRAGRFKGDRRSNKRGTSIEFADYRSYVAGDDLRQLDWNIYARLDRPTIKLLEDEQDLAVQLILDASASMDFPVGGEPAQHKLLYAKRIVAGLAYIALSKGDRLSLTALQAGGAATWGGARGRGQVMPMLRFLQGIAGGGIADLDAALQNHALQQRRPGLTLLVSDMFSRAGAYRRGLDALLQRGHEVVIVHVLAPEELQPAVSGDLRLVDAETAQQQEVTVDSALLRLYERRLQAWRAGLRQHCRGRGAHYFPLETDRPWQQLLLRDMRRSQLLK